MPDQPAALLTAAARRLRAAATLHGDPGPWVVHQANGFLRVGPIVKPRKGWTSHPGADLPEERHDTAEYIALMHPGVGLAVAAWLAQAARTHRAAESAARRVWREDGDDEARATFIAERTDHHALAVARAVLGQDGGQQ
ncbi:hypothetical protein ACIGZJ_30945 [Kitasatospora sp. NPDC052868]|uniref:hypothetical protein n=1 Tax=Kitasatospora sp. NPDC052868 TaxID=3364060 RepID=UPI0037CB6185